MDARWEQGTAEVAKYQAQRVIYQKPRDFEYTFILVKETFNEEVNVKTDDYERDDLYDVMKVNKFARIPTDNYPYHYMTSLFFRRNQPGTVHKLVNTSQEWCGTTAKYFVNDGNRYTFGYNSYWDGQGIGETTVDGDMLFEDQLSYSLRALNFAEGLNFTARVAESQVSSKASTPNVYEATVAVDQATEFSLDTDYIVGEMPVWRVSVQLDQDKTNTYWFSGEYPNLMLRQSTWDGQDLELKEVYMDDYWVIN
ncbi:MAG: hypothetical protein WA958_00565 [Tunicatimonas sp.]